MKIYINSKEYEVDEGCTLADALSSAGLDRPGIAVAIGSKVVRRDDRASFILTDGVEITVIRAVCGG